MSDSIKAFLDALPGYIAQEQDMLRVIEDTANAKCEKFRFGWGMDQHCSHLCAGHKFCDYLRTSKNYYTPKPIANPMFSLMEMFGGRR